MVGVSVTTLLSGCYKSSRRKLLFENPKSSSAQCSASLLSSSHHPRKRSMKRTSSFDDRVLAVLAHLSEEELETAARSNFSYLQDPEPTSRKKYAKEIATKYLISKKQEVPLATNKLKSTLDFRQKLDLDGLRLAFEDHLDSRQPTDPAAASNNYEAPLKAMLASGKNYVQGYDKEGRSTFFFIPRKTQHHHPEWTLKESLYTMERAIACSKAPDHSINAVIDFAGFSAMKHSPPFAIGKDFVLTLRNHYAGQVHKIFLLDAPASFSMLWKLFRPLLGKATQDKIVFVSGTAKKQAILGEYYDPDQATPFMLPNGTKTRDLDLQEYLYKSPFDQAFDEVPIVLDRN